MSVRGQKASVQCATWRLLVIPMGELAGEDGGKQDRTEK